MDPHSLLNAVILGVVEGLTEFLPVSSTGHLIIVSDLLGLNDEKGKVFDIVIQLGAILAVCWEFRARFARALAGVASDPVQQRFALNLFVAFLPAAIVGLAFQMQIKAFLFNPVSVAMALIVGALVIFAVERSYRRHGAARVLSVDDMTSNDALKVGLARWWLVSSGGEGSPRVVAHTRGRGETRAQRLEFTRLLVGRVGEERRRNGPAGGGARDDGARRVSHAA